MICNSLVSAFIYANLIKYMQEKPIQILKCPINFFRTLQMNLTGYFYINMQAYLLVVYDIGFRCLRALLKYVLLMTQSLITFFSIPVQYE